MWLHVCTWGVFRVVGSGEIVRSFSWAKVDVLFVDLFDYSFGFSFVLLYGLFFLRPKNDQFNDTQRRLK